jgi:hypothetical protein
MSYHNKWYLALMHVLLRKLLIHERHLLCPNRHRTDISHIVNEISRGVSIGVIY